MVDFFDGQKNHPKRKGGVMQIIIVCFIKIYIQRK